jgi:hypothetical protein
VRYEERRDLAAEFLESLLRSGWLSPNITSPEREKRLIDLSVRLADGLILSCQEQELGK